ncbi:MAG: xanthine dehydrogenase family protein molybdopterin-binding subunit [Rhodospirillaceae bacterium]|nr:xanthine dehydrogenase family protein molybdopterin-binding subunit [Rhodospirillaceae bacterium]MDE0619252.1 xanthine dehydrogenase family protein molybdopterin-binding subunit [Rhodospirillaceae bacterium]
MTNHSIMDRIGPAWQAATGTDMSRRRFIKLTGASGLAIGLVSAGAAGAATPKASAGKLKPGQQPGAFLHIDPKGVVTIQINRLEFGQGSHTGLARILADELDADWNSVRAELAPAGEAYKDPAFGLQMTGGSNSIQNSFMQYRELGARARAMLVEAAARKWKVDAATVRTRAGRLIAADGRSAGYGEMSEAAMALPVPAAVTLKKSSEFRLIGKPANRLDSADKSNGRQIFGMDMRRPGMKTVLIARPPHFGGTVAGFDAAQAQAVKGVDRVMQVDLDRGATGVAVVADGYWPAHKGRDKLEIQWKAPAELPDSRKLDTQFAALLGRDGLPARPGDLSGMAGAKKTITADFRFPFLAHAPMEPLNAVIEMSGTGEGRRCDIWTGTQFQTIDQLTVAKVLKLKPQQVRIHTMFAGGGFGRRATPTSDYLADAARVMSAWLAAGRTEPLKVVWTREDDIRGGYYRPLTLHRAEIGLGEDGRIAAWKHTIVSPSILKGTPFEAFLVKDGVDGTAVEGVADTAYDLPIAVSVHHPAVNVPMLWWRSVGHTHSAFVMETLIDRVASEAGRDPAALRRDLLKKHPRHLAALDLAVQKSGYGKKTLPAGRAWGIAVHESFRSVVAHVVELSIEDDAPKLHRVTSAIHCNLAVNPRSVEAQIEGSVLMAIGTTLDGAEITLRDGVVEQSNFDSYTMPRMPDMPPVDVHIVPSNDPPTGVGEPGVPPLAPAMANAIFALTGKPVEALPIRL